MLPPPLSLQAPTTAQVVFVPGTSALTWPPPIAIPPCWYTAAINRVLHILSLHPRWAGRHNLQGELFHMAKVKLVTTESLLKRMPTACAV